jgi:hypothetical protein
MGLICWRSGAPRWNDGKVEYCVSKSNGIDLFVFLTPQPIIPVFHYSNIPIGTWLSEALYDGQTKSQETPDLGLLTP